MKKFLKRIFKIASIVTLGILIATPIASAVSIFSVQQGGTGVGTLTGLVKGNGTSAFTGITTSAGLSGVISDETGSGALTFATDPTFTTRINTPEIQATSSAGVDIHNNTGTQVALFGAGGGTGTSLVGTTNIGSASADYLQIAGGTGALTLTGTGSSTNIDITLTPKGSGVVNTNTLTLTGTGTLNGLDVIDATGEATLESTLDIAGDVSGTGLTAVTIGNDKILEVMLKSVNSPTDEQCLTYESTGGDFEWQTCGSGGSGITVGTTTITSGTDGRIAYNNGGVYGEHASLFFDDTNQILNVGGGTITGYTPSSTTDAIWATKSTNSFFAGLNAQNASAGTLASTDIIAYNDTGTNYIDMGIASSGNTDANYTSGQANSSYLYGYGEKMTIGTGTSGKSLQFITGGTLTANIRMTIDGNGLITHTTSGTTSTQFTGTYNSVTTGIGHLITANGLTSGSGLSITSSSSAGITGFKGINVALTGANNGSSQVTYGGYFSNLRTGTTSQSIALHATTNGANLITDIPLEFVGHQGGGIKFGNRSSTEAAMWLNSVTPSSTNYSLSLTSGGVQFNGTLQIRSGASNIGGWNSTGISIDANNNLPTGGQRFMVRYDPTASANYGQINLGNQGNWAGGGTTPFAGSASGTAYATNFASGYAGNFADFQTAGVSKFRVEGSGLIEIETTITAGGTTGNQTINKPTGTVNFAASATAITVTNSVVTASSTIYAMARTNDTTCAVKNVVPASGSFVINMTAACTAETSVGFLVINN